MNDNQFHDQDELYPGEVSEENTGAFPDMEELDLQAAIAQTVSEIKQQRELLPEEDPEALSLDDSYFETIPEFALGESADFTEEIHSPENTSPEYSSVPETYAVYTDDGAPEEWHEESEWPQVSQDIPSDGTQNDDIPSLPSADEEPAEAPAPQAPPVVKGRPKRKKGEGLFGIPNLLVTLVWLALAVLIGTTLGRMLWLSAAEVLAFGREDRVATVTVYESDSIEQITEKLYKAGLIRYPKLFKLYADFAVDEGEIHPGIWDLNTKYDYHALVKMMAPSSSRQTVKVMIPEGYTCRQIFALLEENKVCTVQDISSYAAYGELGDYWFLEGLERGDKYSLEGFLFPDTYEFYQNDSPRNILTKMLDNFNGRFSEEMMWQIDQLNGQLADIMRSNGHGDDYIASHTLSVREIVTIASMIEKETASHQEDKLIASVIYNRLYDWGGTPAYLNIDATIIYALEGKTDLTLEDLRVDSPYNTYTNVGLTPGPISNPGLDTIQAALDPGQSDYYFYVLDPAAGTHHFSTTQEEHDAFRATLGG